MLQCVSHNGRSYGKSFVDSVEAIRHFSFEM